MTDQERIEKNLRIKEAVGATRAKRLSQECRVFKVKIQKNKLNKAQEEFLKMSFVEAKWLYNHILSLSKDGADVFKMKYNDITEVTHYNKDGEEVKSELTHLSSQARQEVLAGVCQNIRNLTRSKSLGNNVGGLRFVSDYRSINLKQANVSYRITDKSHIKILGCKKSFKVNGLKQIHSLGSYEIANAKLINDVDGYFIAITVYTDKTDKRQPAREIGIDFGCQTSLTLSDETKINCTVEETDRIKTLKRKASRQQKRSNNSRKNWERIRRLNKHLSNRREDAANKVCSSLKDCFIVMQDEQIANWSRSGHGRKIQYGFLGRVKQRLVKRDNVVVLGKWVPTTKLCTECGSKAELTQRDRTFVCPHCGCTEDRDVHAAQNMLWLYKNIVGVERTEYKRVDFEETLERFFVAKHEAANSSD